MRQVRHPHLMRKQFNLRHRGNHVLAEKEADTKIQLQISKWTKNAVLVAVAALLLSIWFNMVGLWTQNNLLSAQVMQAQDEPMAEIAKQIFEHPETAPFFYKNGDFNNIKDKNLRTRVDIIAGMFLDFIESFDNPHVQAAPKMKVGERYMNTWEEYFISMFRTAPILCKKIYDERCWYSNPRFAVYYQLGCSAEPPTQTDWRDGCKMEQLNASAHGLN